MAVNIFKIELETWKFMGLYLTYALQVCNFIDLELYSFYVWSETLSEVVNRSVETRTDTKMQHESDKNGIKILEFLQRHIWPKTPCKIELETWNLVVVYFESCSTHL